MKHLAEMTVENRDGIVVATVTGEVDASNADKLGTQIRGPLTNDATTLVVDLTDTSYIDSAGLNQLFQLQVDLRARQQVLRLVVKSGSSIERTVTITGLTEAAQVHGSLAEALEG
jgi:anti-sigma B factor antagonist